MSNRFGFLLGLGLLACSQAGLEEGAPTSTFGPQGIGEEAEATEMELLNEFSIGTEQVALFRISDEDGQDVVVLRGIRSSHVVGLVDRLREQEPELTFLELFRTLAPEGTQPHPALVRFHDVQARAFGRTDTSVRTIEFDKLAPVEKSATDCTEYANAKARDTIGTPWAYSSNQANMTGGGNLGGILCHAMNGVPACDKLDSSGKLVAVCNDGPGEVSTKIWWRHNGQSWKKDPYYVIRPAGTYLSYWLTRTSGFDKTHVLGVEVIDRPDALAPAYYVRARDAI